MSDLVERLRAAQAAMIRGEQNLSSAGLHGEAADEIERLQSLAGAVSPGPSLSDLKEHELRLHVGDKVYSSLADMEKSDNPFVRSLAEAVKLDKPQAEPLSSETGEGTAR